VDALDFIILLLKTFVFRSYHQQWFNNTSEKGCTR